MRVPLGTRAGASGPARLARRVVVSVVGGALLVLGVVALVLPGPGMLLCIGGLVLLSTEYAWAQRGLDKARRVSRAGIARQASSRSATWLSILAGLAMVLVAAAELVVGLPVLTTVTAVTIALGGVIVIGTTAWSRRQYLRTATG